MMAPMCELIVIHSPTYAADQLIVNCDSSEILDLRTTARGDFRLGNLGSVCGGSWVLAECTICTTKMPLTAAEAGTNYFAIRQFDGSLDDCDHRVWLSAHWQPKFTIDHRSIV